MSAHSGSVDPVLGTVRLVRFVRDRNNDAAFFHDAVGASERVRADTVKDNIDILHDVLKLCRFVIDRLIDSELLERILMFGGCGRNHFGAARFRDWNCETTDSARTAMDQNGLSLL